MTTGYDQDMLQFKPWVLDTFYIHTGLCSVPEP